MAVQVSYPGVYIEEFTPGAPIEGVGTSTAAFIGPAARGELDEPTKITSWDQFRTTFGEHPLPGFFLWYAVRGFFENGGQVCYVVRASNGAYGEAMLQNDPGGSAPGDPIIRVRARQPGVPPPSLQVEVTRTHLLLGTTTTLYQPTGAYTNITGREVTVTDANEAAQFRPGDWLDIEGERVQLVQVRGNILRVANALASHPPATGAVRLADAPAGTQTVRITSTVAVPPGVLVAGTMLTIRQGTPSVTGIVETAQTEPISTTLTTYRVTFREGLGRPLSLNPANSATVESEEFRLVVIQGTVSTPYDNLSIEPAHPRYFLTLVNNSDHLVRLELIEPPPPALPPQNLPVATGVALTGGASENLSTLGDIDYIDALDTLRVIDDVNLVAIPDRNRINSPVQQAVIAHCEQMGERFAVLDSQPGVDLFGASSIETQRHGLDSTRGYAALYYPWLRVQPAGQGAPILVPPSGHICGIMARSDMTRGVHKAPANEIVNGALGLEQAIGNTEQGLLNLQGINIIRVFQTGGRPVLWGARTTATTDSNWQYVNVRRLFLFLEESIEEGIRWAVFEPNNLQLWQKLKRTITEFLTRVWRDGALFGATPKDAFYVRIDEVLNPFSEQALGRLHIEIGIRPAYPAEFIIVRIGIWQGDSEVSET